MPCCRRADQKCLHTLNNVLYTYPNATTSSAVTVIYESKGVDGQGPGDGTNFIVKFTNVDLDHGSVPGTTVGSRPRQYNNNNNKISTINNNNVMMLVIPPCSAMKIITGI